MSVSWRSTLKDRFYCCDLVPFFSSICWCYREDPGLILIENCTLPHVVGSTLEDYEEARLRGICHSLCLEELRGSLATSIREVRTETKTEFTIVWNMDIFVSRTNPLCPHRERERESEGERGRVNNSLKYEHFLFLYLIYYFP